METNLSGPASKKKTNERLVRTPLKSPRHQRYLWGKVSEKVSVDPPVVVEGTLRPELIESTSYMASSCRLLTRGPHSVQEVPDRVRPGRQFAIISRKTFALPAKQTPYTCPMRRAIIINAFIPPFHFCQNRAKMTFLEILQKSHGIIEIER
ncbi:hypothetical protein OUZ56_005033 [Daphnia magna]|uniref:Uncharacterized protein n=1 Tax=Daphnia magna TaxID=35525 RepID=A0ABQ9YRL1_9CRUS|nr:hypothetical protein OUZ56_005033 [Daphnia magna]